MQQSHAAAVACSSGELQQSHAAAVACSTHTQQVLLLTALKAGVGVVQAGVLCQHCEIDAAGIEALGHVAVKVFRSFRLLPIGHQHDWGASCTQQCCAETLLAPAAACCCWCMGHAHFLRGAEERYSLSGSSLDSSSLDSSSSSSLPLGGSLPAFLLCPPLLLLVALLAASGFFSAPSSSSSSLSLGGNIPTLERCAPASPEEQSTQIGSDQANRRHTSCQQGAGVK